MGTQIAAEKEEDAKTKEKHKKPEKTERRQEDMEELEYSGCAEG